jgi:hypothetical protein
LTSIEILDSLIAESAGDGPASVQALLQMARSKGVYGIARAVERDQRYYILFFAGEPDGAVFNDRKGMLFGNKALYILKGTEQFTFYPVDRAIIERIILGCRIFDRNILDRMLPSDIPQVTPKREGGAGVFAMRVVKEGKPVSGQRVSIRKGGQIVGNDFTSAEGRVSFRLLYDRYECVVHLRDLSTRVYEFEFHPGLLNQVVDLDIS